MVKWFLSNLKTINKPAEAPFAHHLKPELSIHPNSTELRDVMMPGGVTNDILGYADLETSGYDSKPLVSTLFNSVKTKKLRDLRDLLTAIVNARPDQAKAILDRDPYLVLECLEEKEAVTSLSAHQFNLKPYQAALSVGDMQMAEMVKSYFAELKLESESVRQYAEQHPKGWEKAEEKKWKPVFKQLNNLIRAIRDSKKGDINSSGEPDYILTVRKGSHLEKELLVFWRLLDASLNEVITVGKRPFPPKLLLKPMQMYDEEKPYKEYFGGRWDDPRALFFLQKVIGYEGIQRFMPVNYVQAHQDSLQDTIKKLQSNQPQKRETKFKSLSAGAFESFDFYPLRARGTAGFNFMIIQKWAKSSTPRYDTDSTSFQLLCENKTLNLQKLCGEPNYASRLSK